MKKACTWEVPLDVIVAPLQLAVAEGRPPPKRLDKLIDGTVEDHVGDDLW